MTTTMHDTIHQLYCTHCTYGTSALHRRDGAMGSQAFEYSTRSGSIPRQKSHEYFRQVEPYMYYRLPADTPPDDFLRLTAADAPHRLVYFPSVSGLKVVAQLCYRQTDTRGRPGSYFGHVLFSEQKDEQAEWSAAHSLQLWGAPSWITEDDPQHPFDLPSWSSLEEFWRGERPAIDERVLLSFLTAPPDGPFDDPGNVIPERWRQKSAEERQALLIDVLNGYLELDLAQRQTLFLAVEPSLAALVFFGVASLLPPAGIVEKISFSTFESHADRPATTLAATTFHDPSQGDFPRDAYQSRGVAINTYNGNRSTPRRLDPPPVYATTLVSQLVDPSEGWSAVRQTLERYAFVTANTADELEELARADRMVDSILAPHGEDAIPGAAQFRTDKAKDYLQRTLCERLAALGTESAAFLRLQEDPDRLLRTLKLVGGSENEADHEPVIAALLDAVSGDSVPHVLDAPEIAVRHKRELLSSFIHRRGHLPPGCDSLWTPVKPGASPGKSQLLESLMERLEPSALWRLLNGFFGSAPTDEKLKYVCACLVKCGSTDLSKRNVLGKFFDDSRLTDAQRISLLLSPELRTPLLDQYPPSEHGLASQLERLLNSLPVQDSKLSPALDVLIAGKRFLPNSAREQIVGWNELRQILVGLDDLQTQSSGILSRLLPARRASELDAVGLELVQAAVRAMPHDLYPDDYDGGQRMRNVTRAARFLVPSGQLPEDFPAKLQSYFRGSGWRDRSNSLQLSVGDDESVAERIRGLLRDWRVLAAAASFLIVVVGLGAWFFSGSGKEASSKATEQPVAERKTAPADRPKAEPASEVGRVDLHAALTAQAENDQPVAAVDEPEPKPSTPETIVTESTEPAPEKVAERQAPEPAKAATGPTARVYPEVMTITALPQRGRIPPAAWDPPKIEYDVFLGKGKIRTKEGKVYSFGSIPNGKLGALRQVVPELENDPIFAEAELDSVSVKLQIHDRTLQLEFDPTESAIKSKSNEPNSPHKRELEMFVALKNKVQNEKKRRERGDEQDWRPLEEAYKQLCNKLGIKGISPDKRETEREKAINELRKQADDSVDEKINDLRDQISNEESRKERRIETLKAAVRAEVTISAEIYERDTSKAPRGKISTTWKPVLIIGEP